MTDNLTEQDKTDLRSIGINPDEDQPFKHAVLKAWDAVLTAGVEVGNEKIPAIVAQKIVGNWPKLTYQETARYHAIYHEIIAEIRQDLLDLIAKNPKCLDFHADEDAKENHKRYVEILVTWHLYLDRLEQEWDAEHPESHIQIAVIIDMRSFIFSRMGLIGHLEAIGFALGDDEFLSAIEKAKEDQ